MLIGSKTSQALIHCKRPLLACRQMAAPCGRMVPGKGFEPSTVALQMRCSTN